MSLKLLTNAAGTKRLICNGNTASFNDLNVLSVHTVSEFDTLIAKHHLVELPITHRCFNLHINAANDQQLSVRVSLFELEKNLPGIWFRGEVSRTTGDRRTVPCYFTMLPIRRRRGVYDFRPVVNMVHTDSGSLAMFQQDYDGFEPIKESVLKSADYVALGIVGKPSRVKRTA